MFTKNFRITNDDLRNYTPETSFDKKLDESVKPFGDQMIIVIEKGGGTQTLPAKYLQNASYFFGSITDDVDLTQMHGRPSKITARKDSTTCVAAMLCADFPVSHA